MSTAAVTVSACAAQPDPTRAWARASVTLNAVAVLVTFVCNLIRHGKNLALVFHDHVHTLGYALTGRFFGTAIIPIISKCMRRGVMREADVFEVADLKLDVLRRKVTREGVEIPLTNKEFMLLHLLVRRQGEALSRTQIASEVWDMNFDSDTNVVDVAIKRLRAKIDHPFEKKLIHTVRSIGYTFGDGA